MRPALILAALLAATTSAAADPHLIRDGANHHLGDDSFLEAFKRVPTAADSEPVRMHVHLQYVHDLLAKRPATSPALAARRAELLGYLDDYIAKGTTPINTYVPYRNPVFIDATGNICAVGYLIERSVGRALPEQVAATHRLDYLEDIATAMPEVRDWVATSGLTLDELASIQPGYPGPEVQHLMGWLKADKKDNYEWQAPSGEAMPPDGPYSVDKDGDAITGKFANKQMVGAWTHTFNGKTLGKGTFTAGSGTWTSFRSDGTKLAQGAFVASHASGEWKIFHPSGRIAASGPMTNGRRNGTWSFYYDVKGSPVLSTGPFKAGETVGGWKHYDQSGKLVATARGHAWAGLSLDIEPGKDGIRHEIHQGYPASGERLDGFYLGGDRLYVVDDVTMYDGKGQRIEHTGGAWTATPCNWSAKRKEAAAKGDATTLHDMMYSYRYRGGDAPKEIACEGKTTPVAAATAKRYDAMLASRAQVHAPIPKFDVDPAAPEPGDAEPGEDPAALPGDPPVAGKDNDADFATYLTAGIAWYIEWPHVDATFMTLYRSLPGYSPSN